MIRVNDDYVIQVDALNYTVMRDVHRKTTRKDKKTGEVVEVDAFVTVGYYGDLSGAIRGVIRDMNSRDLAEEVHSLEEALKTVIDNNSRFIELLEKFR